MVRWLFVVVMFAPAATTRAQMSLDALRRDGYVVVPITRPEKNLLLVRVNVNGKAASLILDTGVSMPGLTFSSLESAPAAPGQPGVETATTVSGRRVNLRHGVVNSLVIGNAEMKSAPVYFGSFGTLIPAAGFMGAGFLRAWSAIIDLHNLCLYLRPPGTGRQVRIGPALKEIGFGEAPFRIVDGACYVDVEINGIAGVMLVDTGAYTGNIDPRFAVKAKIHSYRTDLQSIDAAGAPADVQLTRVSSFKIAGVAPLRATYAHISAIGDYSSTGGKVVGLLGMDILGPNGTIIDFAQQKLYFFKAR